MHHLVKAVQGRQNCVGNYGHHASKAALNMAGKRLTIDLKDLGSGNSGVIKHTCGENVFDQRWVERKTRDSTAPTDEVPRCQDAKILEQASVSGRPLAWHREITETVSILKISMSNTFLAPD